MNKMSVEFVPYKSSLAPAHATHKAIHVIIGNSLPYDGKVTIALTKDAVWVVSPNGQYEYIPLKSIEVVKLDHFPGFVYKDPRTGAYIAPNDTSSVTIEYRKIGRLKHRISFLTYLPTIGQQWIRLITEAIDALYQQSGDGEDKRDG